MIPPTKTWLLFLIISAGCNVCAQQPDVNSNVAALLKAVSPQDIKSTIAYLADDRLLGRYPGTKTYDQAVEYVVSQLTTNRIEPAGDNGTYLQTVRFRKASTSQSSMMITIQGKSETLTVNKDYVIYPHFEEQNLSINAPVVFAGYGIKAPEFNYNDYANIDVKGKIVLVLRGAPIFSLRTWL